MRFTTSGTTGEPIGWLRTPRQIWAEAEVVARVIAEATDGDRPQSMLSFAPPSHLYGVMATAVLPAYLRIPVTYVAPGERLPIDNVDEHQLIAAIPSTFALLLNSRIGWSVPERVTFLHSTAVLPAVGTQLVDGFSANQRLIEIFGSTETGAVATRLGGRRHSDWVLCEDVQFEDSAGTRPQQSPIAERLLEVRSPGSPALRVVLSRERAQVR
ncbi:AMP-binding protein [Jatrophihabitans sp. GAS493]|uniref:AMP-binding protein n=1 Tax=Jatrophihabitans sp. GAS493 TaxID=1907575 RepID=UPI0012FD62DE|nr:AMP-binding protein [Jatrophihabitans sp. GAS493]